MFSRINNSALLRQRLDRDVSLQLFSKFSHGLITGTKCERNIIPLEINILNNIKIIQDKFLESKFHQVKMKNQ